MSGQVLQLGSRPKNSPFGTRVEPFRVEQGSLVVISEQANATLHNLIDTLFWVRSVPYGIAQTEDFFYAELANVSQDSRECLDVAVDVADQRSFQVARLSEA